MIETAVYAVFAFLSAGALACIFVQAIREAFAPDEERTDTIEQRNRETVE